jgi:hypothetical protein
MRRLPVGRAGVEDEVPEDDDVSFRRTPLVPEPMLITLPLSSLPLLSSSHASSSVQTTQANGRAAHHGLLASDLNHLKRGKALGGHVLPGALMREPALLLSSSVSVSPSEMVRRSSSSSVCDSLSFQSSFQ